MTIRFYDFNSAGSIALPQDYLDWLATDNRSAIIETSMGTIELELYEKKAPITTANFISLAQDGFYDGLIFHRVMDDFVIQGGDPLGTGTGGSDTAINLEIHPNLRHIDGAISMARTPDPNSATSQFFICDGAQEFLDDQYAVFGVVTDGIEVVRAIAAVDTDDSDKPDTDVVITTITIE
ncbi:MAG: peptidylprolyl isomerase [Chloroflexi bacterium]|nr:peptidylprolyl isomerase [Chloroflexota bacterium]MBT7080756.1 peptidylprolyl isomerase [Chloroflexota bacterium]MBT7290161.1 peptidylprolyl isomerase [Chloroflexota bacterium]